MAKKKVHHLDHKSIFVILLIIILICLGFAIFSKLSLTGNIVLGDSGKELLYFGKDLHGYRFPYYGNADISQGDKNVQKAIIVVHGTGRNAESYWNSINLAAGEANQKEKTLIIAPSFKVKGDSMASKTLYWDSNNGWKQGDKSSSSLGTRRSSFEIIDAMINELNDKSKYPNLTQIIVTGHSAGGQFVNRYAAGNQVNKKGKLPIKYVIANPSSYLYFTKDRWFGSSLRIPDFVSKKICPNYNDYKYGLDNRNTYMSTLSGFGLRAQYASRNVVYLLGKEDDNFDSDLDKSCGAMLEGFNREERGNNYFKYINEMLPSNKHTKVMVPGVGHSARSMYTSDEGVRVLFG
jgi:hypothetical protein